MHRVERAVIMAAGVGSRMRPVTLDTPKPLVQVNGVRMIDTIIRGLRENGIEEIYVVVGYRKKQFRTLEEQYPGLRLIENPDYEIYNNISSLYVAREHLQNAIILDGDQLIRNNEILHPEFERSGYHAVWTDRPTQEWLLTVDRDGRVIGCSRTGGPRGWRLCSVSRWTAEDGARLKAHLELEFRKQEARALFWDDIALFCYPEAYELGIFETRGQDIIEIDSLAELAALDEHYQVYIREGTER